ncbi:MAG: SH3 domain-containing protein [Chroococcales cyanobacterium]
MNIGQKTAVITASLSMAIASLGVIGTASEANPSNEMTVAQDQLDSTCREVATERMNLNVRANPDGPIIGSLPPGTNVTITSRQGRWIPITQPINGFVHSSYLEYCGDRPPMEQPGAARPDTMTQTLANNAMCREVSRRRVAEVRENPTQGSPVMNTLRAGEQVVIENRGANGWIPLETPTDGYVQARYLTTCN